MILHKLQKAEAIHPPKWLADNCAYLTITGSNAYGTSSDNSDLDIYGFCFPPKEMCFPWLAGEVPGFGRQIQRFEQWVEHHVRSPDSPTEYDFSIYGIVKYFDLCMANNPNMIDSLFTPRRCVLHSTQVGEMVRSNRHMFLHKGAWHKFKGYSYAQMSKIRSKSNSTNAKRAASIQEHGYDVKFALHVVRLLAEVEQILTEGDLDLERNREQLKSIRRGEWTLEQLEKWFDEKERQLEGLYVTSTLPHSPDEARIKELLMNCLEHHYGSLDAVVAKNPSMERLLSDLQDVMARYT